MCPLSPYKSTIKLPVSKFALRKSISKMIRVALGGRYSEDEGFNSKFARPLTDLADVSSFASVRSVLPYWLCYSKAVQKSL